MSKADIGRDIHRLIDRLTDAEKIVCMAWLAVQLRKPGFLDSLEISPERLTAAVKCGAEWAEQSETAGRDQEAQSLREAVALLESLAR